MSSAIVASAVGQILTSTLSLLNTVRERAQTSKDTDLKEHISRLYDGLLSLKESVGRLLDENSSLRLRIAQLEQPSEKREPELRQVGAANYYFDGNKGPCCQPCYDGKGKLTVLTPPEPWNGGLRRQCVLCGEFFYEQPMESGPVRIGARRRPYT
jgi:hypothetical protein